MGRIQRGRIFERSGAFYVQYRATIVAGDGKPTRKQVSQRLCERSHKYYSKNAKAVKLLRDDFMHKINSQQDSVRTVQADMSVADFWQTRFLPHCEEIIEVGERAGHPRMKSSTLRGYKQIWNQHLKPHFGSITLQDYNDPRPGNQFLRSLTAKQNKNTLKHIKALGTKLFSFAIEENMLSVNPWHEIKVPKDAIPPKETGHYSLSEAQTMISALVDHLKCQLILVFSCFLALRPGEIAALRWEDFDFDNGRVHIRRSVVRGRVDVPKTPESIAKIPMIAQVLIPLKLWHEKQNKPEQGYLFESRNGTPIDLHNLVKRIIVPHVDGGKRCFECEAVPKPSGVRWKGLYAGRRGACTITIESTNGNAAVAQALLRHKSMTTTLNVYKKQITPEAFSQGMKMLEAKAAETAPPPPQRDKERA